MKIALSIITVIAFYDAACFSQQVSRGQTIVAGEYFTNIDPGAGNGTPIPATYGSAAVNAAFTTQLPPGGILYFRFESSDGTWSAPQPVVNAVSPSSGASLAGGEYSINSDPGADNGTSFPIGTNGSINISPLSMTRRDTLYLRVKDSYGRCSPMLGVEYNFTSISKAEYYIKYSDGTSSPTTSMSLEDSMKDYPIFVAKSASLPALTSLDTAYVRVQSANGFYSNWASAAGVLTAIQQAITGMPGRFKLSQAYPNPFNPSTTIDYQLAKKSHVVITVYDVLGRTVRTLVNDDKPEGSYAVTFEANDLASGIYFYRLVARAVGTEAVDFVDTKKFVVLR